MKSQVIGQTSAPSNQEISWECTSRQAVCVGSVEPQFTVDSLVFSPLFSTKKTVYHKSSVKSMVLALSDTNGNTACVIGKTAVFRGSINNTPGNVRKVFHSGSYNGLLKFVHAERRIRSV
jgi:hypothetical protein